MNYINDLVWQVIQKIRTPNEVEAIIVQAWSNWSGKTPVAVTIELGLTNYKPFKRARVMAEATIVLEGAIEPIKLNLFFHIFADPSLAIKEAKIGQEKDLLPSHKPPVFSISDWQTVVWILPNAPNLRELGQLLDPVQFCQLLDLELGTEEYPIPKLFRYVPLKRALLTWEHPETQDGYFAKLCNDFEYTEAISNFQKVAEAAQENQLGFAVPQIVASNSSCHTFLMTEVPGCQFTEVMGRVAFEPFIQVGQVLAELHSSYLIPDKIWTADKELAILHCSMKGVALALPELSAPIDKAIDSLENLAQQLSFSSNFPIHGNLFGDQILYSDEGIGMVDWDSLCLGDPLYDVGRLIAHLIYLAGVEGIAATQVRFCAEALIQSYEDSTGQLIDRQCLNWHIATQILLRGKTSSLRKLPDRWQDHMAFVVAESWRLLNGQSTYISLPKVRQRIFSNSY